MTPLEKDLRDKAAVYGLPLGAKWALEDIGASADPVCWLKLKQDGIAHASIRALERRGLVLRHISESKRLAFSLSVKGLELFRIIEATK